MAPRFSSLDCAFQCCRRAMRRTPSRIHPQAQHPTSTIPLNPRAYATEAAPPSAPLARPRSTPSSSSKHLHLQLQPPTLSQIRSSLPPSRKPSSTPPQKIIGTVSRTGTMRSTVQIALPQQAYNSFFKQHRSSTSHVLAHEPLGYLRTGDVVEIARFSPATMAERYESGRLDRRGGGVRFEVHRVITPWGTAVEDRKEMQGEGRGELWERYGAVEFERRKEDLKREWNREDVNRRVNILEAMAEVVQMEVDGIRRELGLDARRMGMDGLGEALDEVAERIEVLEGEVQSSKSARAS